MVRGPFGRMEECAKLLWRALSSAGRTVTVSVSGWARSLILIHRQFTAGTLGNHALSLASVA